MCSQFIIKKNVKELQEEFGTLLEIDGVTYPQRILPHQPCPVITKLRVKLMNFSLIPSWSKERKIKFATHNARIETIGEKASWKKPFLSSHCVVPMNSFIEPIYIGKLAGNMVGFESEPFLFAAGITDSWLDKATGEVLESFAIITSEPSEFVKEAGHDRQPVFINKSDIVNWLTMTGQESKVIVDKLLSMSLVPDLITTIDRPLKSGWQKKLEAKKD